MIKMCQQSYQIEIKSQDKDHFEEQLYIRYDNFFSSLGYQHKTIEEFKQELFNLLGNADIIKREEEHGERCKRLENSKYLVGKFSNTLNTSIRAIVLQDEEKGIRYILTIYPSGLEEKL